MSLIMGVKDSLSASLWPPHPRSVPEDYIISQGELLEDFENIGEWVVATGSALADPIHYKSGTQSIELTSPLGAIGEMTKAVNVDFSRTGNLGLWVYIADPSTFHFARVRLAQGGSYFYYVYGPSKPHLGWNFIVIGKSEWAASGAPNWASPITSIVCEVNPDPATAIAVSYDNMRINFASHPKCTVGFDDGFASIYTEAFPIMQARGIKGTFNIAPVLIDTPGYCTSAQVAEMYAAGWDICNHSYNHVSLTPLTQPQVETELQLFIDWAAAQGYTRNNCHYHLSYPYGNWNATVLAGVSALGILSARTAQGFHQPVISMADERHTMFAAALGNTVSLATAESYIDTAIETGSTLHLYTHDLVLVPMTSNEWAIADFEVLMDYLASKCVQIDTVTMSAWYKGLKLE